MLPKEGNRPSILESPHNHLKPAIDTNAMGRVNLMLIDKPFQAAPQGIAGKPDAHLFHPRSKSPEKRGSNIPFVQLINPTFNIYKSSSPSQSGSILFPHNPDILPPPIVGGIMKIGDTPLGQRGPLPDMIIPGVPPKRREETIMGRN
jgi:hypothetical protein